MIVTAVELVLALVGGDGGDGIWHRLVRDQVAAAQVDPIDAEVARHDVEEPLAEEIRLEAAGPAVGADRRLVGQQQRNVDVDILDAIRPGHELRDIARAHRPVGAHVGADVDIGMPAQAEDGAVARAGDLHVALRLARMVHGHEMLAPVFRPFHRTSAVARRERDEKILRIEFAARSEPAADVVLDQLDRAFGQGHLPGERAAVEEQHLGGAGERELPARGVPFRQQPARLHGQRHVTLGAKALAPDIGRMLERGRGISAHCPELDREIVALVLEQERRAACGHAAVGDRGKRLDVDLDQSQRILGNGGTLGEHDGERLADIADLGLRHDRLSDRLELRQGLQPHGDARHALVRLPGAYLLGSDDRMHARKRARARDIDGADAAMRHRAAQDRRMQEVLARRDHRRTVRGRAESAGPPPARSGCRSID